MLRRALAIAALVLAVAAPTAGAARMSGAKMLQCNAGGPQAATGSATFLGRMHATTGTDHMLMRFTLLERFGDDRLQSVDAPELRAWRSSKPGIREFRYRQTVTGLQGGGEYRMRVDFRWLDAQGNLLRKVQKVTGACSFPGDLPNLRFGTLSGLPGPGGTAIYVVPVTNDGKAPATDVAVELRVDGAATDVGRIDSIGPGETRELRFTGPVCKRKLTAIADPADTIHERLKSDNTLTVGCPRVPK
jgi:hypothetical protein